MRRVLTHPDANARNGHWEHLDWAYQQNSPACTETAVYERRSVCRRDGAVVDDARCAMVRPVDEVKSVPRYDGCSTNWAVDYGPWSTTCGMATRTVSSTCMRSGGTSIAAPQPEASCTAPRPVSVPAEVTTSCAYVWKVASYGPWTTTCSPSSTRKVTWSCERSDGATADDSYCSAKTVKPSSFEAGASTECGSRMADPSFESGTTGAFTETSPSTLWSGYGTFRNVTDAKDGGKVVEILRQNGMSQRTGILTSGRTYNVSVWARSVGASARVWLIANGARNEITVGKTWALLTVKVGNAPAQFSVALNTLSGESSAQFDAASIDLVP